MFSGRPFEDRSDRSTWARSVEGRLTKMVARVATQDIVDRAVTAAKIALGSITSSHLATNIPLGYLKEARITANSAGVTTVETDVLTVASVVVGANRRVKISLHGLMQAAGGGPVTLGQFYRDSTVLGRWTTDALTDGEYRQIDAWITDTPAAGTYTYKITLYRALGAGTITLLAGADYPGVLLVEDIGGV